MEYRLLKPIPFWNPGINLTVSIKITDKCDDGLIIGRDGLYCNKTSLNVLLQNKWIEEIEPTTVTIGYDRNWNIISVNDNIYSPEKPYKLKKYQEINYD